MLILYLFEELHLKLDDVENYDVDEINEYVDYSDFTYVDGEEGDYGTIKYYSSDGETLYAILTNNGGDNIDIEFTNEYISLVMPLIEDASKNQLERLITNITL